MNKDCKTIYARYRLAAGITREKAAELLGVAVRTLAAWEAGDSTPPDMRVLAMADIYGAPTIAIEHLRLVTAIARDILPEVPCVPVSQAVCALVSAMRKVEAEHGADRLLEIAADGRVDELEEGDFVQIANTLEDVVAAALALRYAEGGAKAWT